MKSPSLPCLIAAVLGLAAVSGAYCADRENLASALLPSARPVAAAVPTPAVAASSTTVSRVATAAPEVVLAKWSEIKDCTYEMRARFFAGLTDVEARVDQQIAKLKAKRAAMKDTTDTQEWDFQMKRMEEAQAYLRSMGIEVRKASRDTWDQELERVGLAWASTQDAYDNVKSSTTS